jgi:NAD(P)-dependent dehydrogenase (short-subunit alcohol dehydrogenase family)
MAGAGGRATVCLLGMSRLKDRVVVVTGASSGIGRAIALRCAREGAQVVAGGRREDALRELAGEAPAGSVHVHAADLVSGDAPEALVDAAVSGLGRLDGLVHAAGTVRRGEDIRTAGDEELRAFLDENLGVTLRVARAALAAMTAAGTGSLVLVGSQLAHVGAPGYPSYAAAKGGVTALARALAVDAGPEGVRVNVLAPGVVRTPLAYVNRPDFDDQVQAIAARHPLRRIGDPKDMGGPAVFLLSDDSAWMTGQTLIVDGGYTVQ